MLYTVWCSGEHELYEVNTDPWQIENLYYGNWSAEMAFVGSKHHRYDSLDRKGEEERAESGAEAANSRSKHDSTTTLKHVMPRLDALLMVLKTCKGRQCTHPWEELHPDGDVEDLHDAMEEKYDEFYEHKMERVVFDQCEKGYILESEGAMWNAGMAYAMNEEMAYA